MGDPPRYPDTDDAASVEPDGGSPPGMPRWVKISGIIVGVMALLVVLGVVPIWDHR
jgi:hypothetical protein